jgi:hypothetical protein
MHPLVRDLYKRVIIVGRDYPLGLEYVRKTWKKALRNPENCPSCYTTTTNNTTTTAPPAGAPTPITGGATGGGTQEHAASPSIPLHSLRCERELRKAVGKGRLYVREMIGVIQLKKYRVMKKRYGDDNDSKELQQRMQEIVQQAVGAVVVGGGGGEKKS